MFVGIISRCETPDQTNTSVAEDTNVFEEEVREVFSSFAV